MRLTKIEEYLQTIFPKKMNMVKDQFLSQINAPALDLIARGGKRWRPLLMMLF